MAVSKADKLRLVINVKNFKNSIYFRHEKINPNRESQKDIRPTKTREGIKAEFQVEHLAKINWEGSLTKVKSDFG